MYIPKPFHVHDEEKLFEFIENHSFGILLSTSDSVPVATHLPLMLDRTNRSLTGHIARLNPQWEELMDNHQEVLVIFQGPHSYISSSWYETPLSVPTWNYIAVHVYGSISLINDHNELFQHLNDLINKYEDPNSSYQIDHRNKDFVEGLMKGIVGFKLQINRIEGKWKLSQNHSSERRNRVIEKLEQSASDQAREIAQWMRKMDG